MRVVGGAWRGRTLKAPPGRATRPTSDKVREAVFDVLESLLRAGTAGWADQAVLDLFAGSGALGIEALSRGDGTADFVESDAAAAATIAANLAATGFEERATLLRLTAERAAARLSGRYTLVLADPPYYDEGAPGVVEELAGSQLVGADTVLVLEHHRRRPAPEALGPLRMYRSRRHGDTVVSIYRGRE